MSKKRFPGVPGALYRSDVLALLLLLATVPVFAYPVAGYDLSWSTVDGGGGWSFSTVAGYSLDGSAGQHEAGLMTADVYSLAGGFWSGGAVAAPESRIYLPLLMRSH
jgi:hypothetical protein